MENINIEQNLLGILLINNRTIYTVASKLRPEHFVESLHSEIYQRITLGILERLEAVSPVTLKSWASSNKNLVELNAENPAAYLGKLAAYAVASISPEQCADQIIRSWMLRKASEQAQRLISAASDLDADPEEVIGRFHAEIIDIRSGGVSKSIDSLALTDKIVQDLSLDLPVDSTGLKRLDGMMGGGLVQGKLYGFFARKKMGKTSFAITMAHNLDQAGVKHAFICGEMGAAEIHQRFLARVMNEHQSSFMTKSRRESPEFANKILDAKDKIAGHTRYYDAAGLTFDDLKGMVSEAKYRYGVNGVILDYLQLVGGKPAKASESSHLDAVSQWLAEAVKKYKIWILVLGQINQEGNTRGGEGIRLACDMCLELHREDLTGNEAWIEMKDTRYTRWGNLGGKDEPALLINPMGQYFEEL